FPVIVIGVCRALTSPLCPYTTLFRSHRCEGGLQALHELLSRREVCRLALPGIVQREDTTRDRANVAFDLANAVREFDVVGRKPRDRKSTRLNSSHEWISYAVFCLKQK